jgi:hypothetical protein
MVRRVQAEGARVVLLAPPPYPARDIPDCLWANIGTALACTQTTDEDTNLRAVDEEGAAVAGAGDRGPSRPSLGRPLTSTAAFAE